MFYSKFTEVKSCVLPLQLLIHCPVTYCCVSTLCWPVLSDVLGFALKGCYVISASSHSFWQGAHFVLHIEMDCGALDFTKQLVPYSLMTWYHQYPLNIPLPNIHSLSFSIYIAHPFIYVVMMRDILFLSLPYDVFLNNISQHVIFNNMPLWQMMNCIVSLREFRGSLLSTYMYMYDYFYIVVLKIVPYV